MSKKVKVTAIEKYKIIKPIILESCSIHGTAKKMGIPESTVRDWLRKYKANGFGGLENSKTRKKYSEKLKLLAVEDVVIRKKSITETVILYNISDSAVLRNWIKNYNDGKELVATSSGRTDTVMTSRSRKTTFEERIEITEYTIARENDYQAAVEKYGVSYQQIYQWVKKYSKSGIDGLKDHRGRKKSEGELSEVELLKLENKRLKARNEYLEVEGEIRKKLEELKHRYEDFR